MRCAPDWSPRWSPTTTCCRRAPVAASIVGNNQKAVRALLQSYHRIDAVQTHAGLWIEADSAQEWMRSTTGDDIAASRAGVIARGRAQVK